MIKYSKHTNEKSTGPQAQALLKDDNNRLDGSITCN